MNLQNQLDLIYNDIDIDVRAKNLRRFKSNMSLNDLLSELNEFKYD